ncbi:MAG: hypothetical protein N0E48_24270 [Candidatus Thiodiazotropha endolucinida]|nr:hypothetical protein [Candidatus Thiodiazotropha taylori]MCW4346443.1 hypothetical protein [Candidatus Thiodiazotropha endolucinida]
MYQFLIITIFNDHCLRWTTRAALAYPPTPHRPDRPRWYPTNNGLNFEGIDNPTPISQIQIVERQNILSINVFGWDKGITVRHLSKQPRQIQMINLMSIEMSGKFHFTRIKDLIRFLFDQSKRSKKKHFCERSCHGYTR